MTNSLIYPTKNYPNWNSTSAYFNPAKPGSANEVHTFVTNLHNVSPYARNINPFPQAVNYYISEFEGNVYPIPISGTIHFSSNVDLIQKILIFDSTGKLILDNSDINSITFTCDL